MNNCVHEIVLRLKQQDLYWLTSQMYGFRHKMQHKRQIQGSVKTVILWYLYLLQLN